MKNNNSNKSHYLNYGNVPNSIFISKFHSKIKKIIKFNRNPIKTERHDFLCFNGISAFRNRKGHSFTVRRKCAFK